MLFLAALLFLAFLIVGYKLAERIFPAKSETAPTNAQTTTLEMPAQENYLLLQFDDLTNKKPQLIAIWAMLHSGEPYTELFFVSLYPTTDASIDAQIADIVSLKRDHTLTASSLRRLARVFDLNLEGQFVVDNSAFLNLAAIAGVEEIAVFTSSSDSAETTAAIQNSGRTFFSAFCSLYSTGAGNSFYSQLDLGSLMPNHLTSSFSFEELGALLEQASQATNNGPCKVVVPQ